MNDPRALNRTIGGFGGMGPACLGPQRGETHGCGNSTGCFGGSKAGSANSATSSSLTSRSSSTTWKRLSGSTCTTTGSRITEGVRSRLAAGSAGEAPRGCWAPLARCHPAGHLRQRTARRSDTAGEAGRRTLPSASAVPTQDQEGGRVACHRPRTGTEA